MKVVFYASDKPREHALAQALADGLGQYGDEFELRRTAEYGEDDLGNDLKWSGPTPDTDVACVFGVKGRSRQIMQEHMDIGKTALYFDKGYSREKGGDAGQTLYSRVCVNAASPVRYLMRVQRDSDRWMNLSLKLPKLSNNKNGHVLVAMSSQKYQDFYGLGDATHYAAKIVLRIWKDYGKQIVYRPKPSWRGAVAVPFAQFSRPPHTIEDALRGAYCVVTHGSSAPFDAIQLGIPSICLGPSIVAPICSGTLDDLDNPYWASERERFQWASNMAYCQWTADELRTGYAWEHVRAEIEHQLKHVIAREDKKLDSKKNKRAQ